MTYDEAARLINLLKQIINLDSFSIPRQGEKDTIDMVSVYSEKDKFIVDFNRSGRIRKDKYTLQLRYGKDKGLIRIDVGGPEHSNPDGTIVHCPHIHMQKDDNSKWDAWAYSIPQVFGNVNDRIDTLKQFLVYCNTNNVDSINIYEQSEME